MARRLPKHCYERNGVIWGRVKLGGREYRRSLLTSDPREAAKRIKAWKLKLERNEVGVSDGHTFKEAVVRWAKEVLPSTVKPSVAQRYLVSIGQLADIFGDYSLSQITQQAISDYISRRGAVATNATIRRDLTALSRLLASCVQWGWCDANVARLYDRSTIREQRDPIDPPSDNDVRKVLDAAPEGMRALLMLLWQTGMREAEAVNLRAEDVDWERRTITLTRTKTSRSRTIEWRTPGGDATLILGPRRKVSGHLFLAATGEPYANFSSNAGRIMRELVQRELKAARSFRRFRVHDLRHYVSFRTMSGTFCFDPIFSAKMFRP